MQKIARETPYKQEQKGLLLNIGSGTSPRFVFHMGSSHTEFQINQAHGKQCKSDGLKYKKSSGSTAAAFWVSITPPALPGNADLQWVFLGFTMGDHWKLFKMAVSTFPFKFPLVVVSIGEMRLPPSTASCHRCAWDQLSLLMFGEHLGRTRRAAPGDPLLCRATPSSRCQRGGDVAGPSVAPTAGGAGEWEQAGGITLLPTSCHSMWGCLLRQPRRPETRASVKGSLLILLNSVIHRKP